MATTAIDPGLGIDPQERAFLGVRMRPLDWVLLVGLWTIPGVITTCLMHFVKEEAWGTALLTQLPPWLYWVPATPFIVQLARYRPLEPGVWVKSLPVHVVATIVFGGLQVFVAAAACHLFGGFWCVRSPMKSVVYGMFVYYAELNVVCYWGIVAFGSAIDYHRRYRDRELATARLETKLALAQLDALRMQLQPHFLFNTLHAIGVLVRKGDSQGSLRMLTGVSDLLRITLDNAGRQEVALKDELDFVDRYLEVEKTRFQDRLRVERGVDPATLDALVPNLVLQPIVENAIRHGIEPRSEPGTISISTRCDGARLVVVVSDDGVGLGKSPRSGSGMGLSNVRARLEQLFPGAFRFEVADAPSGGVVVTLEIPFRGRHAPAPARTADDDGEGEKA